MVEKNVYRNRELSWLKFNERVLEEAEREENPLCERLSFAAIFQSNLDEFFMVRVGSLFDLARMMPDDADSKTGWTPAEQLHHIYRAIPGLLTMKAQIYAAVMEELGRGAAGEQEGAQGSGHCTSAGQCAPISAAFRWKAVCAHGGNSPALAAHAV